MDVPLFTSSRLNQVTNGHGFAVGAVYNRRRDIHGRLGGNQQSGISTPKDSPFVILFTGRQGHQHGYFDQYGEDGRFYYFGEGQVGDMAMDRGNKAIRDHLRDGKILLLFLSLDRSGAQRFVGEFIYEGHHIEPNVPDRDGNPRNAIVFHLRALDDEVLGVQPELVIQSDEAISETERRSFTKIRTQQGLFRRRVSTVEKGCRLTGIVDLRFLRASHIKPWSQSNDSERVDRSNGLLLTPTADLLFDHGWLSFRDDGRLILADKLPDEVKEKSGIDLTEGRRCGDFSENQAEFLAYHRDCIFGKRDNQDRIIDLLD